MGQILVHNGGPKIPGEAEPFVLPLQGRQLDCIMLVKKGLTSKEIARELGISPRTVDQHIGAALAALGVPNRTAAVAIIHELEKAGEPPKFDRPFVFASRETMGDPLIQTGMIPATPDPLNVKSKPDPILPAVGGSPNTASAALRIAWMFRIAMICSMLTCFLIMSIIAASALAEGLAG